VGHGLALRKSDIDHVCVGPGGIVVVETKWAGDGWTSRWAADRIAKASGTVTAHGRDLGLMFPGLRPIVPVVVLWGGPAPPRTMTESGVGVMHGSEFAEWLRSLPATGTDPAEVERVWAVLTAHAASRDRHEDLERPPARSLERTFNEAAVGAYLGFVLAGACVVAFGQWAIPLGALVAGAGWRFRRRTGRAVAAVAAVATLSLTLVVAIALWMF
jgi:hypothetical protein